MSNEETYRICDRCYDRLSNLMRDGLVRETSLYKIMPYDDLMKHIKIIQLLTDDDADAIVTRTVEYFVTEASVEKLRMRDAVFGAAMIVALLASFFLLALVLI